MSRVSRARAVVRVLLVVGPAVFPIAAGAQAGAPLVVTGKVTAADGTRPLQGVSVVLRGTRFGTLTNAAGTYRVQLPAGSGQGTLSYKLLGFKPQDVPIQGRTAIDVSLETSPTALTDVVVTANAIVRESKELGYATSIVQTEQLNVARGSNVLNNLAGKVAGVRITQQSGTVGGSAKIVIRGINSIASASEPLFVVDGVPISNSSFFGTETEIVTGGVDVGNRAQDLNPDDIESMSILKGAAASALYGSRARNGVIVVTTKRGRAGRKPTITYNASVRSDNVFRTFDLQNQWAQGNLGVYNKDQANGWGPAISGQRVPNLLGDTVTLQAFPDNVSSFFRQGATNIQSLGVEGGTEASDYRLSGTWLGQSGIVPGSELSRYTVALNAGQRFSPKFNARVAANYVRTTSEGRPSQGQNTPNLPMQLLSSLPRTLSNDFLRANRVAPNGTAGSIDGTGTSNNPYWVTDNNGLDNAVDRIYGNVNLSYDATPWLNLVFRAGTDLASENRRFITRKGTRGRLVGEFDTQDLDDRELNTDLIGTIQRQLTGDLGLKAIVGHNFNKRTFRQQRVFSQGLNVDLLYTQANAAVNTATNFRSERQLYGAYGDLGLSWKNYLFVNVTGRNDWSSTLPVNNNSYFYPSVSSSLVVSDLFKGTSVFQNGTINLLKLRANWANVGSDEDPYQLAFTYSPLVQHTDIYTFNQQFPFGGASAFAATNVIPPSDLRPQRQNSSEYGIEGRFFNDRVGADLTYYRTINYDQIVSIAIPQSTGFSARRSNIGQISNRGIEAQLSVTPIRRGGDGFKWDVSANINANRNRVDKLAPRLNRFIITSGDGFGIFIAADTGKSFGIEGVAFARDTITNTGEYLINPANGLRIPYTRKLFGNIFPDWTGGISNSLSWKRFTASFLVDIRQGGVFLSQTTSQLRSSGLAAETANRERFIQPGRIVNPDGRTTRPNDVLVASVQQYWGNLDNSISPENNIFDASFAKLREATFGVRLPDAWVARLGAASGSLAIEGRNLWLMSSKVPHVDPEANVLGTGLIGEGVERNSIPSARTFGMNLRLVF
jgi:TonB-linked SusC/RagA family outer membrane protein